MNIKFLAWIIFFGLLNLLLGCGQSGRLVLPPPEPQHTQPTESSKT